MLLNIILPGYPTISQCFRVQRILSDDNPGPPVLVPVRHLPLQLGQGAAGEQGARPHPVPMVARQLPPRPVPQPDVLRRPGQQDDAVPRGFHPVHEVLEGVLLPVEPEDAAAGLRPPPPRTAAHPQGPAPGQGRPT